MIKKIFHEMISYIKEEKKFFITWIIIFLICTIKLPFYIEKTGGLIDISSRLENTNLTGSLNMAYVSTINANIPNLILAKLNDNWDIYTLKEEYGNSTKDETEFRNKLALKESINHAIISAYNEANLNVKKENNKIYVTYIYEEANTDLKIKDQLLEINDVKINSKSDISKYIENCEVGESVKFKVLENNKELEKTATIIEIEGIKIIGIMVGEEYSLDIQPKITINFKSSESGPSGGLMMALAIYSKVTGIDLTDGLKIAGTGTIDEFGNVGSIDGVKYKLAGAVNEKADIFLVPNERNYLEAIEEQEKHNYNIKIIGVSSLKETIEYLKTDH